ncbi:MAG: thioredoxin domain-containing protein, partial [Minisyncoccales bacterium]
KKNKPIRKDFSSLTLTNRPTLGKNEAPIKIVEFLDFNCPYCKKFSLEVFPKIKEEYISKGLVQVIFKNFPLTLYSQKLALASECAFEQGKFWEFHDLIFKSEKEMNDQEIKDLVKKINLEFEQFNSCFDSQKYLNEIGKDLEEGTGVGVRGTPTFFVNKIFLPRFQSYEEFKKILDNEIQKMNKGGNQP